VEDLEGVGVPKATVCVAREPAATPRCTTTDEGGGYSLVGERPGAVSLVASARGYVAAPAFDGRSFRRIRVPVTGTLGGMDLLLRPGGREVSGRVRDVVGGPIEGAIVAALDDLDVIAASRTLSDDEGRFSLWVDATSFVWLRASAEGYVTEEALEFRPAGPIFELVLSPEAILEGRVVDAETGAGLADVVVDAQRGRHDEPHTARTDAAGRFRLAGLRPGRYKPRVQDQAWLGHARQAVALELGETVGGVLIEAHAARQLAGRVQRPGGELCIEGRVTLRDASGEDVSTQRTDDMGEVRLGGLLPGEYTVGASCQHQVWARKVETPIDLLNADVEGAVWEVPEAYQGERALRGRVVGPDGQTVAFAGIEAVREGVLDDGTMVGPTTLTDREGRFSIEDVPAGLYSISVEAEGFAQHYSKVEILERDVDVELELTAAAGLRIHTRDPRGAAVAGVQVKVAATIDRSAQWLTTNAEGWAEASDLVPGTYRLVVSRPGVGGGAGPEDPFAEAEGTPATLTGAGQSEVTLTVPARDGSVRGRALRADGDPVADALVTVRSSWTYLDFVGEPRNASVGEAHTDDEGRFVVEGLEAESFTVSIQDAFGQTASQDEVEPGASVALELPAPGRMVGTVEIESEAPPEQFTVTVTPAKGQPHSEAFLRTGGQWSIVGVPPGTARVEVSSAWGTAQAKAKVEAGREAAPITLRLAPRGRVHGRVVGAADGKPMAGVHVVVLSDHGPATGAVGTTNAEGDFELANAPSGSVVIKVIAPVGYRPQRLPIEVPSGELVELGEVRLEALTAAAPGEGAEG
jgi:protocatechuate 3,4-dioxygenase beta subunit